MDKVQYRKMLDVYHDLVNVSHLATGNGVLEIIPKNGMTNRGIRDQIVDVDSSIMVADEDMFDDELDIE